MAPPPSTSQTSMAIGPGGQLMPIGMVNRPSSPVVLYSTPCTLVTLAWTTMPEASVPSLWMTWPPTYWAPALGAESMQGKAWVGPQKVGGSLTFLKYQA